ncbi:MAG: hypothetical protein VX438_02570 [Planctomycetota bacterium]|nr:hypothetical protein [Planctomycetota bacterium]
MILGKVIATFVFEFSRSLTTSRIATSMVLTLFAPVMLGLIGFFNQTDIYTRIPAIGCLILIGVFHLLAIFLAVLLWATPVVYSELEGKTWTYLAIRPNGKLASTLGKFVNAVFWATMTASISLTCSCIVVSRFLGDFALNTSTPKAADLWVIWYSVLPCLFLGSLALSAIFIHIGLIAHKRGMVFAVIYGVVDSLLQLLPAVIRQFTVSFHLRNLAIKNANFEAADMPQGVENIMTDDTSIWMHALALLAITLVHLGASIWWLHAREYINAEEA